MGKEQPMATVMVSLSELRKLPFRCGCRGRGLSQPVGCGTGRVEGGINCRSIIAQNTPGQDAPAKTSRPVPPGPRKLAGAGTGTGPMPITMVRRRGIRNTSIPAMSIPI